MEKDRRKLLLKFAIQLHSSASHNPSLLFHRWFPEGEKDCIELPTENPSASLTVWFDRQECSDGTLAERKLTDEEIPQTGVIRAGPLRGRFVLSGGMPSAEFEAVVGNVKGPADVAFGKRIVNDIIAPPVSRFLEVLRVNFGQYWIEKFEYWDSRSESLGQFCRTYLNLKWSSDDGETWTDFLPDEPEIQEVVQFDSTGASYRKYLTANDWAVLATAVKQNYTPPPPAELLSIAHQAADATDFRNAFVIAVTALELAIDAYFREIHFKGADKGNLQSRLLIASSIANEVGKDHLRLAIKAIHIRNQIVHKGHTPRSDGKECLYGLLSTTSSLLAGPKFIFPSAYHGNIKKSVTQWESPL